MICLLITWRNKSVWVFPSKRTRSTLPPLLRRASAKALLQVDIRVSSCYSQTYRWRVAYKISKREYYSTQGIWKRSWYNSKINRLLGISTHKCLSIEPTLILRSKKAEVPIWKFYFWLQQYCSRFLTEKLPRILKQINSKFH